MRINAVHTMITLPALASLVLGACDPAGEPSPEGSQRDNSGTDGDDDTDGDDNTDGDDDANEGDANEDDAQGCGDLFASRSDQGGFDTASWWLDTGSEVVVFGSQFTPGYAQAVIDEIATLTDSPIAYVIATHPNPDKFNGAPAFQAVGAAFITSEATADAMPGVHAYKEAYFVGAGAFEPGTYPALAVPDITFANEHEVELEGDCSVELVTLDNSGVSSAQTIAMIGDDENEDDVRAVVVGDLFAGRSHAWLEGGIIDGAASPDLAQWAAAIDEVVELAPNADVYPGRGDVLPVATAASEQKIYLSTMESLVADYLAKLDGPLAEFTGPNANDHYAAITAQAEAAFPTYSLAYMVTFGVYGLVFDMI